MKNVIFIFMLFLLSCKNTEQKKDPYEQYAQRLFEADSIASVYQNSVTTLSDSIAVILKNSLEQKKQNDSLKERILLANYKIGRVKYRRAITAKNKNNLSFIVGWLGRIVDDYNIDEDYKKCNNKHHW